MTSEGFQMIKLVGIAGSIAEESYNRTLLKFIAMQFNQEVDIELLDINDVPMFTQDDATVDNHAVAFLSQKIQSADGVIIATPEHNHTVPAALKSVIEWLSYKVHPFDGKPVMIVGASYLTQGTSRAQLHLRQILEAPGVNAVVLPGNEVLVANAKQAFDDFGILKDTDTVNFIHAVLRKFITFVKVINTLDKQEDTAYESENLDATNGTDTTVLDVDMTASDWLEQAALKTNAVEGNAYVKLDRGLLTVNQLNYFLNTMPIELTFADDNNQFIYYNKNLATEDMLAPRKPGQVGNPMSAVHPPRAVKHVKQVIHALREGKVARIEMPVPGNGPKKHVMHYYQAMHDETGQYRGVNEWVVDLWPIMASYLRQTGKILIDNPMSVKDADTGASEHSATSDSHQTTDADTGASEHANDEPVTTNKAADADTGASEHQ
ncbi:NADPH-dependent oxidoreductase [Leuconostoc citreum]|nr:NADPH-dependent oxidoreductase [Leuconostoc citreum]MCT3055267.1 NADPH-dependent oxidoreductase [Leuconostoc citreum]MCT3059273.1 NADPH-dependent oxidoreductase [Leuconostoc citreum]MCT3063118.1 NADPH-dependent oxidoreductase [Leuconostoc citreum]MCT3070384.1 NADPH-dependent oxidoreductase [Leuconostoc citreum]MCT3074679.1 NADPH-dependent oxidoreductase [Leuconostoc citreum]